MMYRLLNFFNCKMNKLVFSVNSSVFLRGKFLNLLKSVLQLSLYSFCFYTLTSASFSDWESDVYDPEDYSSSRDNYSWIFELIFKIFELIFNYPWLLLILLIPALFYLRKKYVNSNGDLKKDSAHLLRNIGFFFILIIWFIVCFVFMVLSIFWINRI
jgi:hypothetical protein